MSDTPLNCDRDAVRWAKEFNEALYKAHGIYADDGLLIGWFANAMMCGEDTYRWKHERQLAEALVDAERYRWLRTANWIDWDAMPLIVHDGLDMPELLDAALDAARRKP